MKPATKRGAFQKGAFVRIVDARDWTGDVAMVLGYDARRAWPYRISVAPREENAGITIHLRVGAHQLEPFYSPPTPAPTKRKRRRKR